MVNHPLIYIDNVIEYTDIFVFHYESDGDRQNIINKIKILDRKVGIAINPDTSISKIIPYLKQINVVLIMAVKPGYSGQKFLTETIDKANFLFDYRQKNNLNFVIDVDGGVNSENAKLINAEILTSASAILKANNPNSIIQLLKL